jgi:hypothetical protein
MSDAVRKVFIEGVRSLLDEYGFGEEVLEA